MNRLTWLLMSFLLMFSSAHCFGKDHPRITIQVVNSRAASYQRNVYVPGQRGHSETNCNTMGNATLTGTTAYGSANTNCSTTTTPGRAPQIATRTVAEEYVKALLPDGRNVVLWCQQGYRKCLPLAPGSYEAQIDGNALFIFVPELSGKERKVKYKAVMVDPVAPAQ